MESFKISNTPKVDPAAVDERKTVTDSVRGMKKALIPAALVAAFNTGDVQAESIEMINGHEWSKGVEMLRDSVMNDNTEVGANFILGEDGAQIWYSFGTGDINSVTGDPSDFTAQLDQFSKDTGEAINRVCHAHTHNLEAMVHANLLAEEEVHLYRSKGYGPSAPPSLTDIDLLEYAKTKRVLEDTPHFDMVLDGQGVWYSRIPTPTDYAAFPKLQAERTRQLEINSDLFGESFTHNLSKIDNATLWELVAQYSNEAEIGRIQLYKDTAEEYAEMSEQYATISEDKRTSTWDSNLERARTFSEEFTQIFRQSIEDTLEGILKQNDDPKHPLIDILFQDSDTSQIKYFEYLEMKLERVNNTQFYVDTITSWVEASMDGQVDESMLPTVYEAFMRNNAYVRFVSYESIPNEPPCAGPDYKGD